MRTLGFILEADAQRIRDKQRQVSAIKLKDFGCQVFVVTHSQI